MANCTVKAQPMAPWWTLLRSRQAHLCSQGSVSGISPPTMRWWRKFYVSPRDVGQIQPGQEVRMQVDAFHYTEWGMLRGR